METLPRLMTENHIAFEAITSYVTVAHPQLEEMVTALTVRVSSMIKNKLRTIAHNASF